MREAAVPGYRLSRARASSRVLISLGLVGLFLGLLGAAGLTLVRTGLYPSAVRSYYLGVASESGDSLAALTAEHSGPRPFGELAEVTHLHLMGGSILLFLLCHLLALCDITERTRTFLYVISFASFLSTFALPWLIVYASPQWASLFGPSIIIFIVSLVVLLAIPLKEMWVPRR